MMAGTVMHPTMTPASLAPLNIGSVLDCGGGDSDELGVDEAPASSAEDVVSPETGRTVFVVFSSESG